MPLKKAKRIWFSKNPDGHCVIVSLEGLDSAAFRAFGGGGRQFGRRLYPLPARWRWKIRQRQPSAFRLSSADRSAAIRHRRQMAGCSR